jgi:hypothetical protein
MGNWDLKTYNRAFFFGPGLPLGLGAPSGPNATPELLLTPFFLIPSVGGGISEGTGVPLATGVLEVDSGGLSPFELAATGSVFEVDDDEESFEGDSSLICSSLTWTGATSKLCRALGDNFKVMIMLALDDFRRAPEAVDGLLEEAIVELTARRRD